MLRVGRLIAAAVVVAAAPQLARAEGPPPASIQVYCQPGSLNNCFAFAIESADGHVTYWLQNLQGSLGGESGSPFGIHQVLLVENRTSLAGSVPALRYQPVMPDGSPIVGPQCLYVATSEGVVRDGTQDCIGEDSNALPFLQRRYFVLGGGGLMGCDPTGPFLGTDFIAQTCLPQGLNGWLRLDASLRLIDLSGATVRAGTFEDLFVSVEGCDVFAGALSGRTITHDCSTSITYADVAAKFTTVPEPTSIALLGSGLLGTGVVGTVRSRRKRV